MEQHDIEACVTQAKKGDKEALTKILAQYKSFIFKYAYQHNIRNHDTNDLVQIGYLALLKAIKNYKVGSNTFCGYAIKSIKNNLLYTSRQNAKYSDELSLNFSVFEGQDSSADYTSCLESGENIEDRVLDYQELHELKAAVSKLPQEDMDLIHTVYYGTDSLYKYAQANGLSYFQVLRKKDRILKKLNNSMRIN
jgi:RNA polymerase sigma factor (sigma-70 family)